MNILLSGFEPFGENLTNPSLDLILSLRNNPIPGYNIHTLILPVVWRRVWEPMQNAIMSFKPDLVIAFGLKASSNCITLEKQAHNWNRETQDNSGDTSPGIIAENGLEYLLSTLPLADYFHKLTHKGIPVAYSEDAGGYLCNHLFYRLQNYFLGDSHIKSGFIHLPVWGVSEGSPCLSEVLHILLEKVQDQ